LDLTILIDPAALVDLEALPPPFRQRVFSKIYGLRRGVSGPNVKRLTNFSPRYRLRVGDYRVLFDVEGATVTAYRVLHRRDAYR